MIGCAFLFSLVASLTPTDQAHLQAGLKAYWGGDYQKAATQFKHVTDAAPMAPNAWYNYGTALAQQGQTGLAVYAFERALLLNPSDSDTLRNLTRIKRKTIELISESDQDSKVVLPALERRGTSLFRVYDTTMLNWLFGAFWLLYFLAFWFAREGSRAKLRTAGFFFSLVFFLLSAGVATLRLGRAYWVDQTQSAVVVTPMTEARQGPGAQYRAQTRILDGVKVKILGEQDGWTLIEYASNRTAWVEKGRLKTLPMSI